MHKMLLIATLFVIATGSASGQWLPAGASDTDPIERTGSISVGTNATPLNKLYVFSAASADGLSIDGTNNPAVVLRSNNVIRGYGPGVVTSYSAYFSGSNIGDMIFRSESNSILFGRGSGAATLAIAGPSVGIGTVTPNANLDIDSGVATSNELRLGTGPSGATGATNAENKISFALGSGNVRLAQISGVKNSVNDLASIRFRTIDGGYHLTERMIIAEGGNVGIGTVSPSASSMLDVNGNVNVTGNITMTGNINAKYQDVAEWVPVAEEMAAGTVVVVSGTTKNTVGPSQGAYDTRVAGVVSAQPGVILGEASASKAKIATTGRVKVRVDATRQPIAMGDLLVTSDRSGMAMKSEPLDLGGVKIHRPGTLIGKALEPLATGQGEILVLLSLQ